MTNTCGPVSRKYDLILLGGGATALCFAMEFCRQKSDKRLLILEKRHTYTHDRTWSFWLNHSSDFRHDDLIRKTWNKWTFSSSDSHVTHTSDACTYATISSGDFYVKALSMIEKDPRIDLIFDCDVDGVNEIEGGNTYQVFSSKGTFETRLVYDTRPPHLDLAKHPFDTYQIFIGLEIKDEQGMFTPDIVSLMDHMNPSRQGLEFLYVLPFCRKTALMELTLFTPQLIPPHDLKRDLKSMISQKLGHNDYHIAHVEAAVLPMGRLSMSKKSDTKTYKSVGTRGGFLRESSGYGFLAIYEWSLNAVQGFVNNDCLMSGKPTGPLQTMMDRHFIKTLKNFPEMSPKIFISIARSLNGDQFARFMSGSANLLFIIKVILGVPKIPFLKSLWK